jgi:molecular chaperone HtpG
VLSGDRIEALARSAQLEGFRARGIEVLLLTDPIDAFWPDRMDTFDDKPIRSVTAGAADLAKLAPLDAPAGEATDVTALVAALKAALEPAVADVRATDRLVDSAVVLGAGGGPDLQMQRLLRRAGQASFEVPPVLEINPRHALIAALAGRVAAGEGVADQAGLLLDLARIQDGDLPRDPADFARRVEAALAGGR